MSISTVPDGRIIDDRVSNSNVVFMQKPLKCDMLMRKIRELIDRDIAS